MQRTTPNKVPYQNYFGGKSGDGVYQSIINHIPPHRVYMSLFAGNDGVFKHMRRAEWSIINDIDYDVFSAWYATGLSIQGDVRLFNIDARDFLRCDIYQAEFKQQLKHTFVYLDPPYLRSTRRGQSDMHKHEFAEESEHRELLELVLSLPNDVKVMISHYPCPLYDEVLKGWQTYDFQAKTRKSVATERIYMNYVLDGHLHDYSYIGSNFRVREKYKRIMTNFFAKLDRMEPLLRNAMLQEYELQHRNKMRYPIAEKVNIQPGGWYEDADGQMIYEY